MADPALGQKQICPNCQSKFYDLAKRPAHCPKCDFEFDPEEALKNRRARPRPAARDEADDAADKPVRDEDAEAFEEEAESAKEIDEAAEEPDGSPTDDEDAETGGAAPGEPEPDLGVDFDEEADAAEEEEEADDVPFLEDEDGGVEADDIPIPGKEEER